MAVCISVLLTLLAIIQADSRASLREDRSYKQYAGASDSHSFRLVTDLTNPKRYNRLVRPVLNDTSPVDVTMKMNLYQIIDVVS